MICDNCIFEFDEITNSWWDENSSSSSVKVVKCPKCNKINIIKYIINQDYFKESKYDFGLDKYIKMQNEIIKEEKE